MSALDQVFPNDPTSPKKFRSKIDITLEALHAYLQLPQGVEIMGVSTDLNREVISVHLRAEGLCYQAHDGSELRLYQIPEAGSVPAIPYTFPEQVKKEEYEVVEVKEQEEEDKPSTLTGFRLVLEPHQLEEAEDWHAFFGIPEDIIILPKVLEDGSMEFKFKTRVHKGELHRLFNEVQHRFGKCRSHMIGGKIVEGGQQA